MTSNFHTDTTSQKSYHRFLLFKWSSWYCKNSEN